MKRRLLWISAIFSISPALFGQSPLAHVRLTTAVSSDHSEPSANVSAVVIAPVESRGGVLIPAGTILHGSILFRHATGLGIVHERSTVALEFHDYQLSDGTVYPLIARVQGVDNARETVSRDGTIRGVLAADSPQQVLNGVWTVPSRSLFQNAILGLTGANGAAWKSYAPGPFGAAGVFALRCAIFRLPDPEIRMPAGTELTLRLVNLPADAPVYESDEPVALPAVISAALATAPVEVTTPEGKPVRDIINLAFDGDPVQVTTAFQAAGWTAVEEFSRRSVAREYQAFTEKRGYAGAPASLLLYGNREPDFVFEKSFNDVALRHHIRIWQENIGGRAVWVGAATHDIGIGVNPRKVKFTHRIDKAIDEEREKVLNDLIFAGCSAPAAYVARPDLEAPGVLTDRRLAYLKLQACSIPPSGFTYSKPMTRKARMASIVRRIILEGRQFAERENSVFWAYRVTKWSIAAVHHHPAS